MSMRIASGFTRIVKSTDERLLITPRVTTLRSRRCSYETGRVISRGFSTKRSRWSGYIAHACAGAASQRIVSTLALVRPAITGGSTRACANGSLTKLRASAASSSTAVPCLCAHEAKLAVGSVFACVPRWPERQPSPSDTEPRNLHSGGTTMLALDAERSSARIHNACACACWECWTTHTASHVQHCHSAPTLTPGSGGGETCGSSRLWVRLRL